ncbi:hypothetical protein VC36_08680 [Pseudomonas marginalis]|nr:hypothetical protein VC36_08680 [Pseudomonas marginalis]
MNAPTALLLLNFKVLAFQSIANIFKEGDRTIFVSVKVVDFTYCVNIKSLIAVWRSDQSTGTGGTLRVDLNVFSRPVKFFYEYVG